jgi:hypothetical protein
MDIIIDLIVIFGIVFMFLMPFVGGWAFLLCGVNALADYDSEFDKPKKKHTAILDIILGGVLLLFFNGIFWLVVWPFFVFIYPNLPIFSWPF